MIENVINWLVLTMGILILWGTLAIVQSNASRTEVTLNVIGGLLGSSLVSLMIVILTET